MATYHYLRKERRGMWGKLYRIKSRSACEEEGIVYTPLPTGVAGHPIVVLSSNPDSQGNVRFVTITSSPHSERIKYYPIAPTARKPYPFQLHLRDYNNQYHGPPSSLPLYSYVRAEVHTASAEMLVEFMGDFGDHLMLKNESIKKLESALRRQQTALPESGTMAGQQNPVSVARSEGEIAAAVSEGALCTSTLEGEASAPSDGEASAALSEGEARAAPSEEEVSGPVQLCVVI